VRKSLFKALVRCALASVVLLPSIKPSTGRLHRG
jgi:hypothetical protein